MPEVEVKAKVANLPALKQALTKLGVELTPPLLQDDAIFTQTGELPTSSPPQPKNILRIRQTNDRIEFNLKQDRANELDCLEYELTVSAREPLEHMLQLLGYQPAIQVKKTRQRAHYQTMDICLDQVDDLGVFIELEQQTDAPGPAVQAALFAFLQTLGVGLEDRVTKGYDTMLKEKRKTTS